MEKGLLNRDDNGKVRCLALDRHLLAQPQIAHNHRPATDAEGLLFARDKEKETGLWILQDVAKGIGAAIARAVGDRQCLVVQHLDKAGGITLWRYIHVASSVR